MAVKSFSEEQLNFFKFSTLVLDEFPKVLRQVFITMWDSKIAVRPGFIVWDDSTTVRNMLLTLEGGKTEIPITKSIEGWDCTALFKATIYAKTFGVPSGKGVLTLNDVYLKKSKPVLGYFHPSVQSSTGNEDETYALVIEQLRLLRNTLCHSPKTEIVKSDFDNYVQLVKSALSVVNVDTTFVDVVGEMSEDDFPIDKMQQLSECRVKELQAIGMLYESMLYEGMEQKLSSIYERTEKMEEMIGNISLGNKRNAPESSQSWEWKARSKIHRKMFTELLRYGQEHPNEVNEVSGVRVCCSRAFMIGRGANGTRVYVGLSKDGFERAVKRLPKDICTSVAEQEMKVLTQRNTSESNNVIRYWFFDNESDKESLYLILDLCEEMLKTYVDRESLEKLEKTAPKIIRQVLKGLVDLHRGPNPILHRDLKPSNILRDVHDRWLLADFGISRILSSDETTYESGERGTKYWRAVESYTSKDKSDGQVRYKKESDIQVAGMIAYYIVTKGEHPFGEERDLLSNLLDGKPVGLDKLKDSALIDLLSWMLCHDPTGRPSAEEALKHPYLQTKEQQFELLCNMGNQHEIKTGDTNSHVVGQLNLDSTDWRTLMDADVLKYLSIDFLNGKPKTFKYGASWTECLRLMRNVNQHWKDRPRPRPQPEAFYLVGEPQEYFLKVFPNLPVVIHRIVRSCHWKERPELHKYFK